MSGSDVVQAALEPLWPAFGEDDETGDVPPMTQGQRAVAYAWVLTGLVDNGGVPAWIESFGHRTPEARSALAHLGATEYVPLLDEVMRLYPTFAADHPSERLSASEAWTDEDEARLQRLDESFHRLAEGGDLVEHHAAGYVSAHPAEFPARRVT